MAEQQQTKKRILIIEDDPLLIKMYKTKLMSEGFEVLTATDGQEGLDLALKHLPDAIILDVMMPKLSGLDMLKKLNQDKVGAQIPVVIISNLSQADEAQQAKELGAKEYLVKANFTPKEVIEKVKQYL